MEAKQTLSAGKSEGVLALPDFGEANFRMFEAMRGAAEYKLRGWRKLSSQ
jgi:hypothetical protein